MVERGLDKLSIELSNACDLSAWISTKLNGAIINNVNPRSRVVASYFSIALNHYDAVLSLLARKPKIYASAFALMRLVFESHVRGLWFLYCASDEQIEKFIKGDFELPKTPSLIESIEKTVVQYEQYLSKTYSASWKQLCDYTHTGILQIERWNNPHTIEANYSDENVIDLIRFTKTYAFASAVSYAEKVICSTELANEILAEGIRR